jgi:hypothetical protein
MQASRLLASLMVVALASIAAGAPQSPAARPAGAQASAVRPSVAVAPAKVDFGKIGPESLNPATFKVTNTGATPLKIVKAMPSCKCTAISPVVGTTIAPGETIDVSASLKAPSVPGIRDAKVFLSFEGYTEPVILMLVGDVVMDVVCEPAYVDALQGRTAGVIKVTSRDGKPFSITSAGGAAPVYEGFDPTKDQPRAEYQLKWNTAGMTTLPIWWVVTTDRESAPILPLRVRNENTGVKWDMARFDRQWHVKDGIVFVGAMKVGQPVEHTIEIEYYNPPVKDPTKARAKKPNWAALKSVRSSDPTVKIEVVESKVIGDASLEVKIRITGSAPKTVYADCLIETETGTAAMPLIAIVK